MYEYNKSRKFREEHLVGEFKKMHHSDLHTESTRKGNKAVTIVFFS